MKTRLLFLTLVAVIGFNFAFAEEPEIAVKKIIVEQIKYPDFAVKELLEGKVYATFSIDEKGKITVKESNSAYKELKEYVVEKLNNTTVSPSKDFIGKVYSMKFSFELIK
jgi:hypothetical protein